MLAARERAVRATGRVRPMDLFDKAREAFAQVTAEVSRGTEYLSLQTQMGNVSAELERQLVEVGKRARELAAQGVLKDATLDTLLRRCDELDAQLMDLRQKAQEAQRPPTPPPPAVPQPPGAPAAPPPPAPPPAAESARTCTACGAELAAGAKFCGQCGAKVES